MDRALAEGHKELIYVEGVNDAAILQARGMTNVVASVSAGFDKNQIETLKRHGIESVILLNDADDGGCKGTFNNIRNLTNAGIDAYAPQDGLPENVDPDEYINQYGVEALKTLLSDPQHGIKWVVSRICSGYNTSSDKEARKAYNEVCRWIKNNISQYKMDAYLRKILNEALYIELGAIDTDSQSESWEDRPLPDSFSQGAIANWLEEQYRPSLAWDIEIKEWRRYGSKNPGVWTIEPVEFVRQVIQSQLDAIAPEFADDKGNLPDYTKNFIDGVENLMRSKLAVRHWDVQDRNLLPLKNGVLHLQTLEFREHAPGYRLTWALPYNYDPSADCEPIKEWLHYMCQGDESLVELIRAFLYGVVAGRVDWQKYLELIGPGGTGKSTVIRLATALVGLENTHTTTLRKLETSQFETANLKDKRLTVITDSERYTGPVNVLKALTGQDSIPYEQKYKQATSGFVPQSLVIVAANEQIQSADYTSGLERRRITVPFNKTIPSREQRDLIEFNADGGVYGEFADVIPGLLNWVLAINPEKSTRFVKDHIKAVPSLGEMKAQSLVESNPIADWLDNAIVYRPEHKTQVGVAKKDKDLNSANQYLYTSQWLYANYCEYCANTQSKPIGIRRFTNLLLDLCQNQLKLDGVYRDRDRKGRYFVGLKIRTDEDNDSALITGTESSPDDGSVTDAVTGRDGCVTAKTPGCAKSDGCDGSFQKSFLASDDIKNKTSDPPMGEMIENDPSHPAQSITHGESDPSRYPSQPDTQPVTDESNSTQRPSTGDSDPSQNGDCGNSDCATESDYKELLFEEREAEETQPTTTHPPLEDYEIGQRVWFMNEKGQWRKGFIADSRWLHDGNFKNWQFRGWLCRESKWQMEGGVIIPYQQCIMPLVND
jgi:putative DNA primase/helicase